MKKHILCLGDSNTHGYCADPNDCADHGIPILLPESDNQFCLLLYYLCRQLLLFLCHPRYIVILP